MTRGSDCLVQYTSNMQCDDDLVELSDFCLESPRKTSHQSPWRFWSVGHFPSLFCVVDPQDTHFSGTKGRTFARKWTWRLWLYSKTWDWSTERDLKSRAPPREPPPSSRSVGPMFHWTSQLIECCPIGCFTVNLNSNNAFSRTRITFLGKHPKQKFHNNSDLVWLFLDNPGSREPV